MKVIDYDNKGNPIWVSDDYDEGVIDIEIKESVKAEKVKPKRKKK